MCVWTAVTTSLCTCKYKYLETLSAFPRGLGNLGHAQNLSLIFNQNHNPSDSRCFWLLLSEWKTHKHIFTRLSMHSGLEGKDTNIEP